MKVNWIRIALPAVAALVMLVGMTSAASAARTTTDANTHAVDVQDEEVEDGLALAVGSPAYDALKAILDSGVLPEPVARLISRLLEQGADRPVSPESACRRIAKADGADVDAALVQHCREWIDAQSDTNDAFAACRRIAQSDLLAGTHPDLVERCRAIVDAHDNGVRDIKRACALLAEHPEADVDPALAARCQERADRQQQRTDRKQPASDVCERIARFASDRPELVDRCRTLLDEGVSPEEILRTLRAELKPAPTASADEAIGLRGRNAKQSGEQAAGKAIARQQSRSNAGASQLVRLSRAASTSAH